MTQLSRFPLKPKIKDKILQNFCWLISSLSSIDDVYKFLNIFLTETEKTMLAKRLAILLMLHKGYSHQQIRDILKVSTSTIIYMNRQLNRKEDGYNLILKKFANKQKLDQFWKELLEIAEFISRGKRVFPRSRY